MIVVGPDRVGKTSLCKALSGQTGIPVFKCPSEKEIFKNGGADSLSFDLMLTHFLQQTGHRMISDRGYPCEWVYSSVFGRKTDYEKLEKIDAMHRLLGTNIVFVYSSVPPREEDDLVPRDRYMDVVRKYRHFCEWTNCRVFEFDSKHLLQKFYDGGDASESFARRIIRTIDGRERKNGTTESC